jgi:hypothetical protein
MSEQSESQSYQSLLDAFRIHYGRYEAAVQEAVQNSTDSLVLARLGDDLAEFSSLVEEVSFRNLLYLECSVEVLVYRMLISSNLMNCAWFAQI